MGGALPGMRCSKTLHPRVTIIAWQSYTSAMFPTACIAASSAWLSRKAEACRPKSSPCWRKLSARKRLAAGKQPH